MFAKLLRPLILSFAIGMAIYLGSVIAAGRDDILDAVSRLGLSGWTLILSCSSLNYALRFGRWQRYLHRLGHHVPASSSALCYLAGFAFTTTPAKVGEVVRSVYLKPYGVNYTHSLAVLFAERVLDLLGMVALAMLAILYFEDTRWLAAPAAFAALALVPLIRSARCMAFLEKQRRHLPTKRLHALAGHVVFLLNTSALLLRSRSLYEGFALAILAWGAEGVAFHCVLQYLDIELPLGLSVGIYAVSGLAGALSFIPGGLGSMEVVMGLLLVLVGTDPAMAVAATIICRVATLWFAVMLGSVVVISIEVAGGKMGRMSISPAVSEILYQGDEPQ